MRLSCISLNAGTCAIRFLTFNMACNQLHSVGLSYTPMERSILYLSVACQNVYKTCADPESFERGVQI